MLSWPQRRRIRHAIRRAEAGTTGHVAVRVVRDADVDPFARATAEFETAGLHRAEHRNAALILVAPRARRFAVIGDSALHERVGPAFWDEVVARVQPAFAAGKLADGIERAIESIGEQFHAHFAKAQAG
ncbi:MAG TPA: TPM domain-containing protein [Candidatus Baltobacteraceae bacterium]